MRKLDLTDAVFGKLKVVRESPKRKHGKVHWECVCECGVLTVISGGSLKSGLSRSCGCGIAAANVARSLHGMTSTAEHKAWRQLIARCESESNPAFMDYGARGISVFPEWRSSFFRFFDDMGPRPSAGHSIDRIDTNGNYEPGNCRWATREEQSQNTRTSRVWIIEGVEFSSGYEAAKHFNVDQSTIARWCNGYLVNGQKIAPRDACSSVLKYQEQP